MKDSIAITDAKTARYVMLLIGMDVAQDMNQYDIFCRAGMPVNHPVQIKNRSAVIKKIKLFLNVEEQFVELHKSGCDNPECTGGDLTDSEPRSNAMDAVATILDNLQADVELSDEMGTLDHASEWNADMFALIELSENLGGSFLN